jgi:3-isopropylmalate/(R)-2-methylmalate dehydratase small subunit
MLPIILNEKKIEELAHYSNRKESIEINLQEQEIIFGNNKIKFEIDPFKKKCLLEGLDDIALSLEKSEQISSYENKIKANKPWIN